MWKKVVTFCVIIVALSALMIIGSAAFNVNNPCADFDYSNGTEDINSGWFWSGQTHPSATYTSLVDCADKNAYAQSVALSTIPSTQGYDFGYPVMQYNSDVFTSPLYLHSGITIEWYGKLSSKGYEFYMLDNDLDFELGPNDNGSISMEYTTDGYIGAWYTYENGSSYQYVRSSSTYKNTNYIHIVLTVSNAGFNLYVNGELAGSLAQAPVNNSSMAYILPCKYSNKGQLIRTRLWNSVASATDVSNMYTAHTKKAFLDIDFANLNYLDSTGRVNYRTKPNNTSKITAENMISKDAWREAVNNPENGAFQYVGILNKTVLPKKFAIEWYGVCSLPNTMLLQIAMEDGSMYTVGTNETGDGFEFYRFLGASVGGHDMIINSINDTNDTMDPGVTKICNLSEAHHVAVYCGGSNVYLVVDGVRVAGCAWSGGNAKNISSINVRGQNLMFVKMYAYNKGIAAIQETYKSLRGVRFSSASLTLTENIAINFKVPTSVNASNTGITISKVEFTFNGSTKVVTPTTSGSEYVYSLTDIAPNQMDKVVTAKITGTNYAGATVTATKTYSVLDYCKNMIGTSKTELSTLIVDMVNYGAAAQAYKGETVTINNWLTDTHKGWATATRTYNSVKATNKYANATVTWRGVGLNLNDTVDMRFKIATSDISNLTANVTVGGNTTPVSSFVATGVVAGEYYFYFNELDPDQLSAPITVTLYRNGVQVSDTITYSVESYASGLQYESGNLGALVKAMMKYGDSSYAYAN